MGRSTQRRTYILFTLLAFYILLQFSWWAVLLIRKDEKVAELSRQVRALGGSAPMDDTSGRAMLMIVGEGVVFMLIVLVVLYFTYRAIRRDLSLARTQRNFLLAVTHELRSPIAGIKLQLQTLGRHELAPEVREQLRMQAVQEADRLAHLTEKVLQTTSSEHRSHDPQLEPVDVMALLRAVLDRAGEQLAPDHVLILEGPEQLKVNSDPEALRTITDNLIENAAKYAPTGTRITVEIVGRREGWRMTVCDEGPGVNEAERERIFEKFYRSGNEETRRAKGTGLGLYIVKRLAEDLGGAVGVKPRRPQGSIFVVSFPNH